MQIENQKAKESYFNEQEIIEGNITIDIFMGATIDNSFPDKGRVYRIGNRIELDTTLKYHCSWDWIMPVVAKIESLGYRIQICKGWISLHDAFNGIPQGATKLDCLFEVVKGFAKWWINEVQISLNNEKDDTIKTVNSEVGFWYYYLGVLPKFKKQK